MAIVGAPNQPLNLKSLWAGTDCSVLHILLASVYMLRGGIVLVSESQQGSSKFFWALRKKPPLGFELGFGLQAACFPWDSVTALPFPFLSHMHTQPVSFLVKKVKSPASKCACSAFLLFAAPETGSLACHCLEIPIVLCHILRYKPWLPLEVGTHWPSGEKNYIGS